MFLLLDYPDAVWARVVSYRFYVINAVIIQTGALVQVHSPGTSMSGSFTSGLKILINPYAGLKKDRKCQYYVLSMETEEGLIGANPALGNLIFSAYLRLADCFFKFSKYSTQVVYNRSRFDFLFEITDKVKRYVEVKSCFFVYNDCCFFPLKKLTDLPNLDKVSKNYKPMSFRAIKHFKELYQVDGILVFIANSGNFKEFRINPRQKELKIAYDLIKDKFLLKVQWTYDKKVLLRSFEKL